MPSIKTNPLRRILATKEMGILLVLISLSVAIHLMNPIFFTFSNIVDILRNTSYTLIIAVGMTFVLIARGLDLSVGAVMAFSGLVCSLFLFNGMPLPLGILAGILAGMAFGAINSTAIILFRIPPMIATLGGMYMARGLVLVMTKGAPVYPLPQNFVNVGASSVYGIPFVVIVTLGLSAAAHVVLSRTTYGRRIYAIGGNPETAKFAGIDASRVTVSVYLISGALAALSGILTAARFGSGQPSIGEGTEMTVITAVIIGGASLNGGAGTMLGTILGSLLINVLSTGMNLVGVSAYWQKFVTGLIIVLAVGFDQHQRNKKKA